MQLQLLLWAISHTRTHKTHTHTHAHTSTHSSHCLWGRDCIPFVDQETENQQGGGEEATHLLSILTYQHFHVCSSFYSPHLTSNFSAKEMGWRGPLRQGSGHRAAAWLS